MNFNATPIYKKHGFFKICIFSSLNYLPCDLSLLSFNWHEKFWFLRNCSFHRFQEVLMPEIGFHNLRKASEITNIGLALFRKKPPSLPVAGDGLRGNNCQSWMELPPSLPRLLPLSISPPSSLSPIPPQSSNVLSPSSSSPYKTFRVRHPDELKLRENDRITFTLEIMKIQKKTQN